MLDESRHHGSVPRPIREDERRLVEILVRDHPQSEQFLRELTNAIVEDMADDGMGSIRFAGIYDGERRFGTVAAEAQGLDADHVPVSMAVNLDTRGHLYELDIWKIDFSPLQDYPRPENVHRVEVR